MLAMPSLGPLEKRRMAWFPDLRARYFLAEGNWAKTHESMVAAIGFVAAALSLLALWASYRHFRRRARNAAKQGHALVAVMGIVMGAFFAFLIAASTMPHLLLGGGK
jgi:hypothetical protein